MDEKWKNIEPESTQQSEPKSVDEILSQVNTQEKVDHLIFAMLEKEKQANHNIFERSDEHNEKGDQREANCR